MSQTPSQMTPAIHAIAAQLPTPRWTTQELLEAAENRFTDKLRDMLARLGVNSRHSVLANYPAVLFKGAEPELAVAGSVLATQAAREAIEKAGIDPEEIGLVLGVTSSPSRLLPSLVCDLFVHMPELRRDTPNLSIEYMGCSAIAKAVDCARWFLACQPDKYVLVCFMDAITPLSPPLPETYAHFSEVSSPQERQQTVNAMHGLLFGDASVAMLLSAHAPGPSFGPIVHLTNATACDAELGTVPDGGSDIPVVRGARREYTLSPDVTPRGTFYATSTVAQVLAQQDRVKDPKDTTRLLMHTGSERILDGLCQEFGVSPQSPVVASSYRVLRDYGNTIGCSVPLMLADPEPWPEGDALMVAFGLSFSCGAGVMTVPQGGWAV